MGEKYLMDLKRW